MNKKNKFTFITIIILLILSAVSKTTNANQKQDLQPTTQNSIPQNPITTLSGDAFLPLIFNPYLPGTFLGQIAFSSYRSGTTYSEIFIMNPDGTGQTPLVQDNFENYDPNWSPDNTKIVFVKAGFDFRTQEIYIMNPDGSNQVNITNNNLSDNSPEWSPDGSKIVFVSYRDSDFNIFVMDTNGANQTQLTFTLNASSPTWSPDSTKIAYINDYDGLERITIMNANGTNPIEIYTTEDLTLSGLTWSPNGDKLAFTSRDSGDVNSSNIFTIKIDGSGLRQLTTIPRSTSPSWSPDATQIAFNTNRDDGTHFEVYIMNADGSAQQNITNNGSFHDIGPGWSK